jgi:hypothetical protein
VTLAEGYAQARAWAKPADRAGFKTSWRIIAATGKADQPRMNVKCREPEKQIQCPIAGKHRGIGGRKVSGMRNLSSIVEERQGLVVERRQLGFSTVGRTITTEEIHP